MNLEHLKLIADVTLSTTCTHCTKENKLRWSKTDGIETILTKVGKLEGYNNKGYEPFTDNNSNPFSENAPICASYYPYNGSEIYQCPYCDAVFAIYLETAGHGARYQARWIRSCLQFLA